MAIILVVDDEIGIRELLSEILVDEGYDVRLAENAAAARRQRETVRPDLVLLDIWMPDLDGISLLKEWRAAGLLTMPVIMMSGHGTIDTAVEATRIGAFDFLEKPIALQKLLAAVHKGLKHEVPAHRGALTLEAFARLPFLKEFHRRLEQAAAKAPVLLLRGATGGMAEIAARTLQPPRAPWLDLSTAGSALTHEVLEKLGGGILFVPDLAALGKMQQMNLAFAVERAARFNLQVVVATASPAGQPAVPSIDAKLATRLEEVWVAFPSLTAHGDDVPELAVVLLTHLVERGEVSLRRFSTAALNALRTIAWGRQPEQAWNALYAMVRNLALTALDEEIGADDVRRVLPADAQAATSGVEQLLPMLEQPLREARDAFERLYFEHHLRQEGGNMTRLAERSGLERTHLYRKLKQLDIRVGRRTDD